MTYCVAISTDEGLVFCSDSRTNAGADLLSTYSKMHVFKPADDRIFVCLTAGNLATTQAIVSRFEHEIGDPGATVSLLTCKKMVEAAHYVSKVSREEQTKAKDFTTDSIDSSATLIFGGQIKGGPSSIYLMYSAGNFITDSAATPFLQIGESKYGKPILDRILTRKTSLEDAARCAIVSMDSTIKSNATVGPPIEVLVYENGTFETNHHLSMNEDNDYLRQIRKDWNDALKQAFAGLPPLEWERRTAEAVSNVHPIIDESRKR